MLKGLAGVTGAVFSTVTSLTGGLGGLLGLVPVINPVNKLLGGVSTGLGGLLVGLGGGGFGKSAVTNTNKNSNKNKIANQNIPITNNNQNQNTIPGKDPITPPFIPSKDIKPFVDWRSGKFVSDVKMQGVCGNCYAFSATGALESAYMIKNNKIGVSYSDQQLTDCCGTNGFGCNGC